MIVCGISTTSQRRRVTERASLPRARRGRVLAAGLIVLLCLTHLGFIDPAAIAQEIAGQHRWRLGIEATVLTVERDKAPAAKPGSEFKECTNGCPVMIVLPAGK